MAPKKDKSTRDEPSDGTVAVNDAWTGMLAVSLVALVLGSIFLAYDLTIYSGDLPTVPKFVSPSALKKGADGPAPKVDPPMPKVDGAKDAAKDADKKD